MKKNKKFSDLIIELSETWILWMKFNTASQNKSLPIKERKNAGLKCEELIDRRYEIIDELDSFFNKNG